MPGRHRVPKEGLLGPNKGEKRMPEQISPCWGADRLFWGKEWEVVGLAAPASWCSLEARSSAGLKDRGRRAVSVEGFKAKSLTAFRKLWGGDGAQDFTPSFPRLHQVL